MTFKAKQDTWIEGRKFRMAINFVLLSGEEILRYKAGFENLGLVE